MKYKNLIDNMTLEEKASLMSGKDFWTTVDIDKHGIPSIFLADGPHGIRKQAVASDHLGLNESIPATCYPTAATLANSWNCQLAKLMGNYLGREAVSQNVNVLLGPGTNIKRNPLCGRNFEYFSEDPYLSGSMASSLINGIQSNGISACVKHYVANNQEYRRMVIDTIIDERTLREIYLTPFEMAVKNGKSKSIMSSYNMVNGTHTNENMHLMQDILRKEWEYTGVVVTDWGGSNDRIKGLKAGNELEMPTTSGETDQEIKTAIETNNLDETILDENVNRLLELIFDTSEIYKSNKHTSFDIENHHKMAQKVAEESIVLLKNENKLLPLKSKEKIAIIGDFAKSPRYQGAGSSIVNPTKIDDTLSIIDGYDFNYVGFEQGYNRYGKKSIKLINKAVKLADRADVILLYIGLDEYSEVEGIDRNHMSIPDNQVQLLERLNETGKKVVVILSCGSAVDMSWDKQTNAVVHSYLSGQAGARAILNVITGKVNPSGKLAESYPYAYEHVSSASNFPGQEVSVEYREGLFVGYRYYDTVNVPVRYPFGYGLSYTSFAYHNIEVNEKEVSFEIKNTGDVIGAEVAQLYISAKNSKVFRVNKELKGFQKVLLEPGETKKVTIPFDEYTFRFYNDTTNEWEIENCDYEVIIASSSVDIKLTEIINGIGTEINTNYKREELKSYYSGQVADISLKEFATLLGENVPTAEYDFYKKKRMIIDYNSTVEQLKYSKRWIGRFFSYGVLFANKVLHIIGKHSTANVLIMGVYHQPMRGLSRMTDGAISWGQLDGLIMMFNGQFFKGLITFINEGRKKSKKKKGKKRGRINDRNNK
ncbi:beta-glucosidase [Haloplasma contractile]|uniref:Beta-glucosidase-related glycosidase Carbohydrate transport protein n=1 Tax=Haloplasma contractile SSD-17B TaxID=1033810 RepID=F7Q1S9_9MOLU|nr:glycoside hydrolase family 3 C-terminal domain-containing protein [Haloplasma contractile]ERJ12258.1 Beta-glucosidase-related glycosidase Carbohydrate transport protein [Haloplasma contractile SSD-17B]